jgi:plastocyanin
MKDWRRILLATISFAAVGLSTTLSLAAESLANDTVSFGQWLPIVDRLTMNPGATGNLNELAPKVVTIKAGGAINFAISGFHNVQVFGDGTTPEDIGQNPPVILGGMGGGIIDISDNRIYRGWDPNLVPNTFERDRIEVVHFEEPGTYLVICGVRSHFTDSAMFGYVRVLPGKQR